MKVIHICAHCSHENHKTPKPLPNNPKEAKQIEFICSRCNARNLRDGTVIFRSSVNSDIRVDNPPDNTFKKSGNPGILIVFVLGLLGLIISSFLEFNKKATSKKEDKPTPMPFNYLNNA